MSSESPWRRYRRFFRADPQRDVDEELEFHLAMRAEEYRAAGMAPSEARELAVSRFGDLATIREECGELSRVRGAQREWAARRDALWQDFRYAVKSLIAHRGYAVLVAAMLALGIGSNTALFSLTYGVLLRPLPYRDADALVRLWSRNAGRNLDAFSVSPADYAAWRASEGIFSATGAFERQRDATLLRGGEPQSIEITAVTPDIFPLLGASARLGRTLLADDALAGAPDVAVLSYDAWISRFGSDGAILGQAVVIGERSYTVVGVMPPRFFVPGTTAQVWTPLSLAGASTDHAFRYLRVLGRLAPGVTLERARNHMDAVAGQLAQQFPTSNAGWTVNIRSITDVVVGAPFRRALLVLSAVVAFVLLIACANAANMQLARAAARRKEIALRRALGASRGRVAAQLLLESTFLGIVAGVAGLALAFAGVALLRHVGEATVPRLEDVRLDAPVVVFTIIVALTSGLLFGWLPALGATRADIGTVLKEGGRTSHGAAGERLRGSLVVAEITLSLVLLIGAGLILRSFARLQSVDIGFEPRGVYLASIRLPESSYADIGRATRFFDDLLARARSLPGVTDAAEVSSAPFAGPNTGLAFLPVGHPFDPGQPPPDADYRVITPGYLRVMGIRLVRGRDFSSLDVGGAPVVIVSETLARRQWPNDDPIGKRLRVGDVLRGPEATVIGVAGDARYMSLEDAEVRQMMYLSAGRSPQRSMSLVVRGGNLASLAPAVGRIMAQLDPSLPAPTVRELDEVVGLAMATRRFALVLLGAFAGSALVLTALGLYGVIAYLVRQRTHELGLRIALGATGRAVIRMVLGRAMRLTFFGVVLGLLGAWALTRWLGALLFEVQPTDPATFAAIVALLVVVATLASLVPARRAARADPMLALRGE